MKINNARELLYNKIIENKYYLYSLISIFFLIVIYYFITWPIVGYDTDLWYHLSGGRYFWQNGTVLKDAFFSYITPPKEWYNYYWLFQVIIYKLFQWSGYYGLIVFRCIIYCLTLFFIGSFFIRQKENQTFLLTGAFLSICCAVVILYRELLVRPHLFSYLFIILFLYILEYKRDKIWLLPVLGVLWSNIHGIEYPVMFLIVFAYLAEVYYHQIRKTNKYQFAGKKTKWLLISVFYTVFFTPRIIELIKIPFAVSFQNAAYQHLYVQELLNVPFSKYFIFAPVTISGFIATALNIIVLFTVVCFLFCLWKKRLRISHGIIFVFSCILLAQHIRFSYEFTLLSIPLMCNGLSLMTVNNRLPRKIANTVLLFVVIIIPLLVFNNVLGNRPSYPFSQSNLPTGVVKFLNSHASGGKILNESNTGGYLPWALNPDFKIFMDMQMTIFSDLDFALSSKVFADVTVFKKFIREYDPSFIAVSLQRPYFKKVIEQNGGQFVPVFFDTKEALYIKKSQYEDLARKYELKTIDPFSYREIRYNDQKKEKLKEMQDEALRMFAQDKINYGANHILGSISIVQGNYEKAMTYAETLIENYPDLSHGYALKGDALFGVGRYAEASLLYKKALDMGQTSSGENVYRNLYAAYIKLKEYKKAYKLLSQYVNPFTINADYKDIYDLGMSAATVGKIREAVLFLKIAGMKVPATDEEYQKKIEDNLAMLNGNTK